MILRFCLCFKAEEDEYDREFNRMREESLKSKQAKLFEELEQAKHVVEECKRLLGEKRKQAEHRRYKVDRPCIERIRAFQNPPALIGQIMEMVMIMIGKKKVQSNERHADSSNPANSSRDKDDLSSKQQFNDVQKSKSSIS